MSKVSRMDIVEETAKIRVAVKESVLSWAEARKGGAGSGFHAEAGHCGIPGKKGGSQPCDSSSPSRGVRGGGEGGVKRLNAVDVAGVQEGIAALSDMLSKGAQLLGFDAKRKFKVFQDGASKVIGNAISGLEKVFNEAKGAKGTSALELEYESHKSRVDAFSKMDFSEYGSDAVWVKKTVERAMNEFAVHPANMKEILDASIKDVLTKEKDPDKRGKALKDVIAFAETGSLDLLEDMGLDRKRMGKARKMMGDIREMEANKRGAEKKRVADEEKRKADSAANAERAARVEKALEIGMRELVKQEKRKAKKADIDNLRLQLQGYADEIQKLTGKKVDVQKMLNDMMGVKPKPKKPKAAPETEAPKTTKPEEPIKPKKPKKKLAKGIKKAGNFLIYDGSDGSKPSAGRPGTWNYDKKTKLYSYPAEYIDDLVVESNP